MAHYVVGDVHGCYTALMQLLGQVDFNYGKDTLWFTGDIVNRGSESLAVIRFIKQHDYCMQMVLGNHDLHLLTVAQGYGTCKRKDTIAEIINAPDARELLAWLRSQPLYLKKDKYIVVHAGIHPLWSIEDTIEYSKEISQILSSDEYPQLLAHMYGDMPNRYSRQLAGFDKIRFNINVLTRMRVLDRNHLKLDFRFKTTLSELPYYLQPWFEFTNPSLTNHLVIFGHWSALGFYRTEHAVCIDTGAIWGGNLTLFQLGIERVFSVANRNNSSFF